MVTMVRRLPDQCCHVERIARKTITTRPFTGTAEAVPYTTLCGRSHDLT
jgi:hypothetical protein